MSDQHLTQETPRRSNTGKLIAEKRMDAGLSLPRLAAMTRLPLDLLEGIECREQNVPSFEACEKIALAINIAQAQSLTPQELWQATLMDQAPPNHHTTSDAHQPLADASPINSSPA